MKKTTALILTFLLGLCLQTNASVTSDSYHKTWNAAWTSYKQASGDSSRELITSVSQLSSNASDRDEGKQIGYLIDGDVNSFWHSDWHGDVKEPHYIQINLEEPTQGRLIIYGYRRLTDGNHVTRMAVYGSKDNKAWTHITDVNLNNAFMGAPFWSEDILLGEESYAALRFVFLANSSGNAFGHFAEFQVEEMLTGPNYLVDMEPEASTLYETLMAGKDLADNKITPNILSNLKKVYNAFLEKLEALKAETHLTTLQGLRLGVNYAIRGRYDEGYMVYNPEVTKKWVSILGATNESFNPIANKAYSQPFDSSNRSNVWQFIEHEGKLYLYNPGSGKFLYSDGTAAYQLSATPMPVHLVQVEEGVFALNSVTDDSSSEYFASIDLSKETKPVQRNLITDHGAQLVLENTNVPTSRVDINRLLQTMRLPASLEQLTNLPTLYLNTQDGWDITSKERYKLANLWRVDNGKVECFDSLEVRGRGNSTWYNMPKRPYRIKFQEKEKFLGSERANARNWTLMANCADKTLIRNAVASYIGTQLGQVFTPAASFVDLYLNDKYLGNYQVSDHVQIHKKRIAITEQEERATAESDITGGYFLEVCGSSSSEPVWFSTNKGTAVTIKSPDEEVINNAQRNYIQKFVSEFENRLMGNKFTDPEQGYRPMVDSLSLASWFLSNEFTGNADGYYSVYFYKDAQDDHLYFGPLWDFDIAFNNCDRIGVVTNRMMIDAGFITCPWPGRMWKDPWFKKLTGRLWHQSVRDGLIENTLAYVDSLANLIDESQQRNFEVWPLSTHVYNEITLWSTYIEGVDYLKKFIREHADYLSKILPDPDNSIDGGDELGIRDTCYYRILNVGNNRAVDVNNANKLCIWENSEDRAETQQWYLRKEKDGYYRIIQHESNLAITDMTNGATGINNIGTQLQLMDVKEDNDRQLWRLVTVNDKGHFYLENKQTDLAWNNSGGNSSNGNGILSWTNNSDNAQKATRLWYIQEADERMGSDIAATPQELEYRITYNPETQEVHIRIPAGTEVPESHIALYDLSGNLLMEGSVREALDVEQLPHGMYILRWDVAGSSRSIKFMKR